MSSFRFVLPNILLLSLLALSACNKPTTSESTVQFEAELSPKNETPPIISDADGEVEVKVDSVTNQLTWEIEYEDLSGSVTAAHFHGPAMIGEKAGVALQIEGDLSNPIKGEATLTAAQLADLLAGKWYVNLHTAAHPDGEIRGQLVPES